MAILGAWTSLAECERAFGCEVYTGAIKGPYVSEAIDLGITTPDSYFQFDMPSVNDFWMSWYELRTSINNSNQLLWQLYGTDGTPLFRMIINASVSSTVDLQIWTGSAWSILGSASWLAIRNSLAKVDVRLKIADSGGIFSVYYNGSEFITFTGDTLRTAITNVNKCRFGVSYSNSALETISAIILADEPTFDLVFAQNLPTGNGGQTAWAGDYTAIDETSLNNLDFISSDTVGQVETVTFAALNSALNSLDVMAVAVSAVSRVGASGPGNITGVVRTASSNYDASDYSPPVGQLKHKQIIMSTNPSTSAAWDITTVNSHEIGFKSKA